ncbi:MAG: trigger factor [Phycisphaeraceae bacterium]|nr:trigger factor [Phycisphaeraceae bacterium]
MTDAAETKSQTETTTEKEKPKLNVKVEDIGPARRKLSIEVPPDYIKGKIEDAYSQLTDDAQVPGFRRGRAPRRLIEKRFGDSVRTDTRGQIISEAYSQAIEQEEIAVIGEPDIKDLDKIELPDAGSLKFEVEVEVTPTVELPDFASIKVSKPSVEVTDADVEAEIERYAERFGAIAEAQDGQIKAHDYAQVNAAITDAEGNVIEQREKVYAMVHGEEHDHKGHVLGILIDDLGKRLIGKGVGHEEKIEMTGPAAHENEQIRGKPIVIDLKVTKIERIKPAEPQQLITQLGYESDEQMRTDLRTELTRRKQAQQRSDMHQQVRDQLLEAINLELPEGITSRQAERNQQRQKLEMLYRGSSEQEAEQKVAELRSESQEEARKQLAEFFILDAAAKKLEIEVQDNEVNYRIAMLAMQQGRRPEKLRQEMRRRGELENLYLQIREHKTLDKIIEQAAVTDAPPPEEGKTEASTAKKTTKKSTGKKKQADE